MLNNKIIKIFKFTDDFDIHNKEYCEVTISIIEFLSDNGNIYFDISYTYNYSSDNTQAIKCNPFYPFIQIGNENEPSEGEIIVKNSFSEELVKYLLMDFTNLAKYSGNSTPYDYKKKIMETILLFWD